MEPNGTVDTSEPAEEDASPATGIPTQVAATEAPDSSREPLPTSATATGRLTDRVSSRRTPTAGQREWARWAIPAVALLVGLVAGAGIGIAGSRSDPRTSQPYRLLAGQMEESEAALRAAQDQIDGAQSAAASADAAAQAAVSSADASAQAAASAAAQTQAELQQRAAAVSAQAASLSAVQQQIAATSIGDGSWTVGVTVQPGVYRTQAAVSDQCYWEITKSGTNGGDIIQNDIVTGGFPTVTLSPGQDFKSDGCGTWLKR